MHDLSNQESRNFLHKKTRLIFNIENNFFLTCWFSHTLGSICSLSVWFSAPRLPWIKRINWSPWHVVFPIATRENDKHMAGPTGYFLKFCTVSKNLSLLIFFFLANIMFHISFTITGSVSLLSETLFPFHMTVWVLPPLWKHECSWHLGDIYSTINMSVITFACRAKWMLFSMLNSALLLMQWKFMTN